jgi:uncharacterized tellurite resistance protein B-like protein
MDNRVARCHLLAQVLAVDGIVTDDERALLEKHMEDHELSDEERQAIRNFEGGEAAIALLRERPEAERLEIVSQLVEAALADGKLMPMETALVKRISAALGLPAA